MLPDGDGFDILKELKAKNKTEGVIFISAKENLETRLKGFNIIANLKLLLFLVHKSFSRFSIDNFSLYAIYSSFSRG